MNWEDFRVVCPHTSENLRGAVLSSLLLPVLALTMGKAGSGRALLRAAPRNTRRGGGAGAEGVGAEGVRQLDRKTDPDR